MANPTFQQEVIQGEEDWHRSYTSEPPPDTEADFLTETLPASLEETIAVVKDKVWKFSDVAWKGMAEVLFGFGISPSILGYSSVPGQEGSELAPQRDEAESALERVTRDGSLIGSSSSRRLSDSSHLRHSGEEGSLLNQDEEDDDDDNHAFSESIRRDTDERKSLTRLGSWEHVGSSGDGEEDKKDK
jgi:hypothetical protein